MKNYPACKKLSLVSHKWVIANSVESDEISQMKMSLSALGDHFDNRVSLSPSTLYRPMSLSDDNLCKQFGPRSDPTKC